MKPKALEGFKIYILWRVFTFRQRHYTWPNAGFDGMSWEAPRRRRGLATPHNLSRFAGSFLSTFFCFVTR